MRSMTTIMCFSLISFCMYAVEASAQHENQGRFDWMPPEATDDASRTLDMGGEQIIPEIIVTSTPKRMADVTKYTRIYELELKKFGISNQGTDAEATSKGINAALQHAKTLKANRIVFPKGTYLIDEKVPIVFDHKDTIVDLGGSTLQMRTNGEPRYRIVEIVDGTENFRLTNGAIRGDRDTHDMKTIRSSFEGCAAMRMLSGKNMEFDHLTVSKVLGSGVSVASMGNRTRPELLAMIMDSVRIRDLEQGAFSDLGQKTDSTEKMRTIKPYGATKCKGEFEFGLGGVGYQGYPFIKGRVYQVYFYDKDMTFLERKKVLQYKRVTVPDAAHFMHFEINQPAMKGKSSALVARITNFRPPRDVHFHDCHFVENRSLGLALGGGQKWLIENNVFEKNGPDIVGWGVDIEDGWELTQHVVFRNNVFKGNLRGDLVICSGSELLFEGNTFDGHLAVYGRPHNYNSPVVASPTGRERASRRSTTTPMRTAIFPSSSTPRPSPTACTASPAEPCLRRR